MDHSSGDLGQAVAAAVALSIALGGAEVTMDASMTAETAAALGEEIRAGLAGPGIPLAVSSLTVRGQPPRVSSIQVTVRMTAGDDVCTCTGSGGLVMVDDAGRCTYCRKKYP
jgi:hypothetical protein